MYLPKHIVLAGILALAPQNGIGCGPDFPEELIPSRKDALMEPPPALFSKEIKKLIDKPRNDFPVMEENDDTATVEIAQLSEAEKDKITAMRQAEDGDAAYKLSNGLPEAVRLYTAGAVDFQRAFPPPKNKDKDTTNVGSDETKGILDKARQRFEAVLALPEQNNVRAVWAAYMLGRIATYQENRSTAAEYFAKTRQLVKAGLPDPLGLAVSSLGQEARLHLVSGELVESVALYVQQLSYGSKSADVSLKFVAQKLEKDTALLDEALANPLTQRLLFAYLYTKDVGQPFNSLDGYLYKDNDTNEDPVEENEEQDKQSPPPDLIAISNNGEENNGFEEPSVQGDQKDTSELINNTDTDQSSNESTTSDQDDSNINSEEADITKKKQMVWERIVNSIEHQGIEKVSGADWLAAAAYNQGRFDLAQRLADRDKSALAFWIKAKLALHAGNQEAALAAYAEAIKAFPAEDKPKAADFYEPYADIDTPDNSSLLYRINTERGVLTLARGEYIQALSYLYESSARYWVDTAYVAERILTLEELKTFVDHNVLIPSSKERTEATESGNLTPAMRLRQLLARRLMRNGRVDEAINYFDNTEISELAKEYRNTIQKALSGWRGRIAKAEAWYAAALLARFEGMELMGYELAPDFTNWNGVYDLSDYGDFGGPTELKGELISADEQKRFKTNSANPNVRFHYRRVAADHASKAANLLPPSSQAFAVVLCEAASWNPTRDPDLTMQLYKRYLKEGSYVPWGKSFGRRCPEPDFDSAEQRLWVDRIKMLIRSSVNNPYISLTIFILAISLLWTFVHIRRKVGKTEES